MSDVELIFLQRVSFWKRSIFFERHDFEEKKYYHKARFRKKILPKTEFEKKLLARITFWFHVPHRMRKLCILRAILKKTILKKNFFPKSVILNVKFFLKSMFLNENVFVKSMILIWSFHYVSDFNLKKNTTQQVLKFKKIQRARFWISKKNNESDFELKFLQRVRFQIYFLTTRHISSWILNNVSDCECTSFAVYQVFMRSSEKATFR